jgi:hypothetical protein
MTVEVNEPMHVRAWLLTLAASVASSIAGLLSGQRVRVVSYAIENGDILSKLAARLGPIPDGIGRATTRLALRTVAARIDQIAFGTEAARRNYADVLGDAIPRSRTLRLLSRSASAVLSISGTK